MLTETSLRASLPAIRRALFEAATEISGSLPGEFCKAYVMNRHGKNFLRVDVERPISGLVIFRAWGPESRPFQHHLAVAFGTEGFAYVHRLCDALASPATEKVW